MHKCFKLFLILLFIQVSFGFKKACAVLPDSNKMAIARYEDTLRALQKEKSKPQTSDQYKQDASDKFYSILKKALQLPGSFDYPFDSLTTISRLSAPDKKFRIL